MLLIQLIILQIITFTALVLVLKKLLYAETASQVKRLQNLNAENERIAEDLRKKIEQAENEYEDKLRKAEEEAKQVKEEAQKEIEKLHAQTIEGANEEADRIVSQARSLKEKMKEEIRSELEEEVAELACNLIKNAFDEKMWKNTHSDLMEGLISGLGHVDKNKISNKITSAEISTPFILSQHDKDKIKWLISEKVSHEVDLKEEIKRDLIAGAIIKIGNLIIDGSLSNRLEEAKEKLKKGTV